MVGKYTFIVYLRSSVSKYVLVWLCGDTDIFVFSVFSVVRDVLGL